jgi:hypothetical protein
MKMNIRGTAMAQYQPIFDNLPKKLIQLNKAVTSSVMML